LLFYDRPTTGGYTNIQGGTGVSKPYRIKLVRSGNNFTAYTSNNGLNWVQLGTSQTIVMAQTVDIGLAVSSMNNGVLATATFDNVSISSAAESERFDEGRFWKQRRAYEKKWRDPDDVYIDVGRREEERKKQGLLARVGIVPHSAVAEEENAGKPAEKKAHREAPEVTVQENDHDADHRATGGTTAQEVSQDPRQGRGLHHPYYR
jgi:hypothetical protein